VGASVKLTIAVKSTDQAVLSVPVNALSVGADGSSRVLVQRRGAPREYVSVTPGLAAQGLVEVRGRLEPGDLVVVGSGGNGTSGAGSASAGSTGATGGTGASGASGTPPKGATGDSGRASKSTSADTTP
jgi:hypothetical protein